MPSADPVSTPTEPLPISEDDLDDLLYAARTGDLSAFTETLNALSSSLGRPTSSILLQAHDSDSGNSAAHFAAANGHVEVLQYIFSACAAPITDAASPSNSITHTADTNSAPPAPATIPTLATSPLHTITNAPNTLGNTPLHYAALTGQLAAVRLLIERGAADATARNAAGFEAVFEAERAGKMEVVAYLLGIGGAEKGGSEDGVDADLNAGTAKANGAGAGAGDSVGEEAEEGIVEGVRQVGVGEVEDGVSRQAG